MQLVGGDAPAAAIENVLPGYRGVLGGKHSTNSCEGFFPYAPKAPALTGAFYCFNLANNPTNQPPMPALINTYLSHKCRSC